MIRLSSFLVASLVAHVVLPPCAVAQYEVGNKVVLIHDLNLAEPGGEAAMVYEGNIVQVRAIDGRRLHVKIGSVTGWLASTDVVSLSEGVAHFTKLVEEIANDGTARRCRAWVWLEWGEHERRLRTSMNRSCSNPTTPVRITNGACIGRQHASTAKPSRITTMPFDSTWNLRTPIVVAGGWLGSDCRRTTDHCLWPPSAVRPQQASLGNGRRAGGDLPVRFTRTFRPKSRQIDPSHPAGSTSARQLG